MWQTNDQATLEANVIHYYIQIDMPLFYTVTLLSQAEDVGTLDLQRRGITLPPHLRSGTPVLSGVKSRTSFKVRESCDLHMIYV